jgi:creatinine amidohydrolase
MLLAEMKHPEVAQYLTKKRTIILPCGATEQHGLHAPLGTDTMSVFEICKEVGLRTSTVVAPVLPYGFSQGLHCTFPGTISLSGVTFIAVVSDVLKSIKRSGFSNILVITGHGMNINPIHVAVTEFLSENDAHVFIKGYWQCNEYEALLEYGEGIHATPSETAIIMHLQPELVDISKAVDERNYRSYLVGKSEFHNISSTGVMANATIADAEKGSKYFEAAIEGICSLLKKFD